MAHIDASFVNTPISKSLYRRKSEEAHFIHTERNPDPASNPKARKIEKNGQGRPERRPGLIDEGGLHALRHQRRRQNRADRARDPHAIARREPDPSPAEINHRLRKHNGSVRFQPVFGSDGEAPEDRAFRSPAPRRLQGARQGRHRVRGSGGSEAYLDKYRGEAGA